MDSTPDPSALELALARALELRDAGEADWLEQACDGDAELIKAVRPLVEVAQRQPQVLRASTGLDGAIGAVLGRRYRLDDRLGAGAMGVVYRARDQELDRDVAVKVLRSDMIDPDEGSERLLREAEVMASLDHPAILGVFDRGRADDGRPYVVTELCDGHSLSEILDRGRENSGTAQSDDARWLGEFVELPDLARTSYLRLVTTWIADLAAGLESVHRAGILHRDIKPSNVFIRRDGRPVLLDFGVAARAGQATLTREGAAVGTPAYMAPEVLRQQSGARPATDVYGLTATLYHALTLQPPFSGSATQVIAQSLNRDPEPATNLRPGLPGDLQGILDKGLERSQGARYPGATALESDLRAFLDYRPVSARPLSAPARLARRVRRSKLAQGAALVLLLLAILATWRAVSSHAAERRQVEYGQVTAELPPNLTIVTPANRRWRYEDDRARIAGLLDRATALAANPLPTSLLRSSFRFDHDDPAGAAEDMAVVAAWMNTDLARELAARYAAVRAEDFPLTSIALDDLPAVESDWDVYLLGYHCLRSGDYGSARELLEDPRVADIPHAQELRLALTNFGGLSAYEERELAGRRWADAVRLEERVGHRTAATAHVLTRMAAIQGRYGEALESARDGIALAGRSAPLRISAGMMAWRLGLDDEAVEHWGVAIDLHPHYLKPFRNLIWLHLDRKELDEAELLVRTAPFGESDAGRAARLDHLARVESERALTSDAAGDRETAVEHAREALALLDEAAALGPISAEAKIYAALDRSLLDDEPQAAFAGVADLLSADPLRWRRLEALVEKLPDDLDADSTAALGRFLDALLAELSSRDRAAD